MGESFLPRGEQHPAVATSLCGLASVQQARGCYSEAVRLLSQALDIRMLTLGETPNTNPKPQAPSPKPKSPNLKP